MPSTFRGALIRISVWLCLGGAFVAPARAASGNDGAWIPIGPPSPRFGQTAVYDPGRDQMVVFGGTWSTSGAATTFNDVFALGLSGQVTWRPVAVAGPLPAGRYRHTMIYDPVRDRFLVFGGDDHVSLRNDVWALSLSGVPAWTPMAPTGTPPSARSGQVAAYDPVNDRMLVFGGVDAGSLQNDLWSLSLSGTPAWTKLTVAGTPPSKRWASSLVFDPARQRLVLHGGFDGVHYLNDTWALTLSATPTWSSIAATGTAPPGRAFHGATFDAGHDEMVVFAGTDGSYRNDSFVLSFSGTPQWSALTPPGDVPAARSQLTMIHDPVRDRDIVLSGLGSLVLDDTWSLTRDGVATWSTIPAGTVDLPARSEVAVVRDAARDRLILFGGSTTSISSYLPTGGLFTLPLASSGGWMPLAAAGTPPSDRGATCAIHDPVRDRMLIFGGQSLPATPYLNEVWELSLSGTPTWTQRFPLGASPSPRRLASAMYDPVRDRMIICGGMAEGAYDSPETWALSLSDPMTWTLLQSQRPMGGLSGHTAFYDPVRDRMVVSGGVPNAWALDLSGPLAWETLATTGVTPHSYASVIYDPQRDRLVTFGGSTGSGWRNDSWALSLGPGGNWTQLLTDGALPTFRASAGAAYDPVRDRMLVIAGVTYDGFSHRDLNDVFALQWSGVLDAGPGHGAGAATFAPPRPNPARDGVELAFVLPRAGTARVRLFDVNGRIVHTLVDGPLPAGPNVVRWDRRTAAGERAAPGLYFIELRAGDVHLTRRVSVTD